MDSHPNLPAPDPAAQPDAPVGAAQDYAAGNKVPADALARASAAVQTAITQTQQNPAARLQAIADIKAVYIKDQFGVDISK